jgi:hypothetical protein
MSVVLPAPLAPTGPVDLTRGGAEGHAIERGRAAERTREVVDETRQVLSMSAPAREVPSPRPVRGLDGLRQGLVRI